MQNNHQENERVRPRLESASELKGKKAEGKTTNIAKKRAMILISLILVLAIATGAYFVTDALRPVEEETAPEYVSEVVSLVKGRSISDMAELTVIRDGVEQYTVISNLKEKAELAAAEQAAAAEAGAAETAAEPAENELQDYEIKDMPYFKANSDAVSKLAAYSHSVIASKTVETDAEDLSAYGLDKPQVQVDFTYHDGTSMQLNIGAKVPTGSYYYMNLDDSNDVYMIYYTVYDYFTQDLTALHIVPAMPAIDPENLVYLLAEQKGKETVEVVLRGSNDNSTSIADVMLIQPFEYDVNSTRASETMISASAIALTGYAGHAQDEAALAEFGLDEPFAVIEVADSNEVSVSMRVGSVVPGNSAYRYATVDETGDVYTVDVNLLAFLDDCRVSYLVDQFAGLINIKRIDGFTIETADKTYVTEIKSTPYTDENGNEMVDQEFYFNGEFVDEDLYRDFYQVVIGRLVDKRIENEEEYYFDGDVAVRLTYDLNYSDEDYVVEYVDYDRDYYAVRRDGVSLFLIRKDKIQEMTDTAELLLNGEYQGIDDTIDYDEIYGDMSYYE